MGQALPPALSSFICILLWLFFLPLPAPAQQPTPSSPPSGYILGPGDTISLFVTEIPDEFANKSFRIDTDGQLSLPILGRIHAGGLSIPQFESACKTRLSEFMKSPQVAVSLVSFGSQPISVLGAVNSPGIHQLEGRKTLFEVLSSAGGLRPDAGYEVKITRDAKWGPIPLHQAQLDPSGQSFVAAVNLDAIINATDTSQNILILPGDAISVPRADLVYVVGAVMKPGGIALNQHKTISALQVVSVAEGFQKTAASDKSRIIRTLPGATARTEIPVNLKNLMNGKGKEADVQLQPNDILFVPTSGAKTISQRIIETAVSSVTGMAIYGRF